MPKAEHFKAARPLCRVAVIWIDWYAYHVARFRGLDAAPALTGKVTGLELVGGVGVHAGLKFREDLPAGLAIETLQPQSSWAQANKLQLAVALWHRLSQLEPKVVLVPGYYTLPALAAALWAKLHRSASVLMTESTAYDHPRVAAKEWAKGVILRALFDWAVAGGKEHLTYLEQLGFPMDRTARFYDVVDNELFAKGTDTLRGKSPAAYHLPARPYFVFVGRFAEEKNVGRLLESWIAYRRDGGDWPLVLVGDGPLAASLRDAATASGFGQEVFFPGLKSSRALLPYYAFAGCFVLPSTREPWGLVVNEAMAAGLPVLVSDRCGCAADLVEPGRNGFLFAPADVSALTRCLQRIAALSAEELGQMGAESRRSVSRYSPRNFGLEIARIADAHRDGLEDASGRELEVETRQEHRPLGQADLRTPNLSAAGRAVVAGRAVPASPLEGSR